MSLKSVYEKLESINGGSEIIDLIKKEIKIRDGEAADNRVMVGDLSKKFDEMQSNMANMIEQIKRGDQPNIKIDENDSLLSKRLNKEIEELAKSVKDLKEQKELESKAKLDLERSNKMIKELNKHGVLDDVLNDTIDLLKGRYNVDEQGVWVKGDGVTMEKDIEDFFSNKPHLLKNKLPSGSDVKKPSAETRNATEFDAKKNKFQDNWKIIKNKVDNTQG